MSEDVDRLKALARAASKREWEGMEYMLLDSSPERWGLTGQDAEIWKKAREYAGAVDDMISEGQEYLDNLSEEELEEFYEWANTQ
jgi:hypothetical protein